MIPPWSFVGRVVEMEVTFEEIYVSRALSNMTDGSLDMSSDRATSCGDGSDRLVDLGEEEDDEEFDSLNMSSYTEGVVAEVIW